MWTPSCPSQLLGVGSPQGSRWNGPPKERVVALGALRLCGELWGLTLKHGLEEGEYVSGLAPWPLGLGLPSASIFQEQNAEDWYSSPSDTGAPFFT